MLFTQLKQTVLRAAACSVLMLAVSGQCAHAANEFSNTRLITHGASSGGKGKDTIALKTPKSVGSKCAKFLNAEVVYKKRRFGEVKMLTKPVRGCNPGNNTCKVTLAWKHAPAGRLNYQLKVNWDVSPSGC